MYGCRTFFEKESSETFRRGLAGSFHRAQKTDQPQPTNLFSPKKGALKLTVLPLLNENGLVTVLGTTISSQLLPQMYEPEKIALVEKSQLGRLINEQSFQKSGLVLSDQNSEIGKLSGTDLLLLGVVQFNDQTFLLQLRVVSLQSGEILALSESVFDSDDTLYSQYRSITTAP